MKETAYLLQATLISLWWIGLLINQEFYDAFQFPRIGNDAFNSFMIPDLFIIAFLSIVRAYKKIKELDYIILGGFGFATLYCINATLLTNGGILSQNINTSTVNWNAIGTQNLSVTASNVCGTSAPQTKSITILDIPNQPSMITTTTTNDTLACLSTETYSVGNQSNVLYNFSLS